MSFGLSLTQMTTRNRPAILRFAALSWPEQRLFLRAVWLLPVMAFSTPLLGLKKVQSWIERGHSRGNKKKSATETDANTIARMVFSAARYGIVNVNCLSRSLTLCYLLRSEGLSACLRLGGRRQGELFEAHAWVELSGRTFDASENVRGFFTPFPVHLANELTTQK